MLLEIGLGHLGLPQERFWGSTINEIMAALRGKNPDGDTPESGALSKHLHNQKMEDKKRCLDAVERIEQMQKEQGVY